MRLAIRQGLPVAQISVESGNFHVFLLVGDFGPAVGVKRSSTRITRHYDAETLVGRPVAAVVNLPPRQVGNFMSQVLVVGFPAAEGEVVLFAPDAAVANGARLF